MQETITVKAYAVLLNESRSRHVVWRGTDPTKRPTDFHRMLGGHVEFGERARDAVVREIAEELGTELSEVSPIGVLESIFRFAGRPGHEVVFLYAATIADGVVPDVGGWFDDGGPIRVEWRAVRTDTDIPLYPDGAQRLIAEWIGTGADGGTRRPYIGE
ncbi:NUDIX hydrolase [Microlunatus ginsengisoli]|uniref:Nudix hydrolase domain-containing protein n=1 Tax=Microlunatus ginsengisoli TaxID=363863 RepID=A0ABP6ZAV2_9ACTN